MKTSTLYLLSGGLFVVLATTFFFATTQQSDCSNFDHTTLVLIDQTDSIGEEARLTAKDYIWAVIEKAPNYSRVVFKEIIGSQSSTAASAARDIELCREIKPSFTTQLTNEEVTVKERWAALMNEVCGTNGTETILSCGSPVRKKDGVLDRESLPSESSPILEEVADAARQYLTAKPQSWDLVVLSDWRQFSGKIDLHRHPCDSKNMPDYSTAPFLGNPSSKIFSVSGNPVRQSAVLSLFVTRKGMSNEEANCLRQFSQGFFLSQLQVGLLADKRMPSISSPVIKDLPQS